MKVASADEHCIEYADSANVKALCEDAQQVKQYLENGGKLGWWRFPPKEVRECLYITKTVRVDGRPCATLQHLGVLCDGLYVRMQFDKAWELWTGLDDKPNGPYVLQLSFLKSLRDAL